MDTKAFELDDYLERVNYFGVVQPTEDVFETLHRAQYSKIPFENFDIELDAGYDELPPIQVIDQKETSGFGL